MALRGNLVEIEGTRSDSMERVFDNARKRMDECDGVLILMQRKAGGFIWYAPDNMKLETLIFYLWAAISKIGG